MWCLVLSLVLLVAASSRAQPVPELRRPKRAPLILVVETAGGIAGGVGGFLLGTACTRKLAPDHPAGQLSTPQLIVGLTAGVVGIAGGTSLTGTAFSQGGKFLPTLAYTAADVAAGLGIAYLGATLGSSSELLSVGGLVGLSVAAGGFMVAAVSPIIATEAYNSSRPWVSTAGRIAPGSVTLGSVRDAEGSVYLSLDIRLLAIRL